MKKVNFKKILSLALCLMLIAPVFGAFDAVLANPPDPNVSLISSFELNHDNRNILAPAIGGHLVVRSSQYVIGGPIPINIELSNARMGNATISPTWRPVLVNNGGGATLAGGEGLRGPGANVISITPTAATVGNTIILEVWVTHFGENSTQLTTNDGDTNRNNFTIATILITVADDQNDGTLGANFLLDAGTSPISANVGGSPSNPIVINSAGTANTSRRITLQNVFRYNFNGNFANNMENVTAFQWQVDVMGSAVVEVVDANGNDIAGTLFTQANPRVMTIRPIRNYAPNGDLTGIHSGPTHVTISIGLGGGVFSYTREIYFDVTAEVMYEVTSPVLISPGSPTSLNNMGSMAPPIASPTSLLPTGLFYVDGIDSYVRIPVENIRVRPENGNIPAPAGTLALTDNPAGNNLTATVTFTGTIAGRNRVDALWAAHNASPTSPTDLEPRWRRLGTNTISGTFPITAGVLNGDDLDTFIPYEWIGIPVSGNRSANVTVAIDGALASGTRIPPVSQTVRVRIVDNALDGQFVSFGFGVQHDNFPAVTVNRDIVAQSNTTILETITIEMDRDGDFITNTGGRAPVEDSLVTLNPVGSDFAVRIYDSSNPALYTAATISEPNHEFVITGISVSPANSRVARITPFPSGTNYLSPAAFMATHSDIELLGAAGTATIIIHAAPRIGGVVQTGTNNNNVTQIRFNITVNNIGVFAEDEGNISAVSLRRDRTAGNRMPTATDDDVDPWGAGGLGWGSNVTIGSVFIEEDDTMTVNINEVFAATAGTANNRRAVPDFNAYIRVISGSGITIVDGNGTPLVSVNDSTEPTGIAPEWSPPNATDPFRVIPTGTGNNVRATFDILAGSSSGTAVVAVSIVPITVYTGQRMWTRNVPVGSPPAPPTTGYRPMTLYFRVIVNELGGAFGLVVDHTDEVLRIYEMTGPNPWTGAPAQYNFDGSSIEFMYALRAAQDGNPQRSERWLPVMGSEIDISRLIPRSGQPFRFAVRTADSSAGEDGNFSEDVRRMIPLPARTPVNAAVRRSIIYDAAQGGIRFNTDRTADVLFRVGLGQWSGPSQLTNAVASPTGISILPQHNPLGGTVEIRFAGDATAGEFASVPFRVRIPRAARAPRIRIDERRERLAGFQDRDRMAWSTDGITWTNVAQRGAILSADLQATFPGLSNDGEFVRLYLRTNATVNARTGLIRAPASPPTVIMIPMAWY